MSRFVLERSEQGLQLNDRHSRQRPLLIDFSESGFDYRMRRGGGKKEFLARAVGVKAGLHVLDCTAGIGRDAYLLAKLGCKVTMLERSPVLAMLLADALRRAAQVDVHRETVARMQLLKADAVAYLQKQRSLPDVIVLDPMFPARRKSASVKGDMQVLQQFIGVDMDTARLIECALNAAPKRLVIKRPGDDKSDYPVAPSHSVRGKSSRFDVFINAGRG